MLAAYIHKRYFLHDFSGLCLSDPQIHGDLAGILIFVEKDCLTNVK